MSGTAVSKLVKINALKKSIARVLTVISRKNKAAVVGKLRVRKEEVAEGDEVRTVEKTIKRLKMKHVPLDLRPKRTHALRLALTKHQKKLLPLRLLKRKLNFPKRRYAVPL